MNCLLIIAFFSTYKRGEPWFCHTRPVELMIPIYALNTTTWVLWVFMESVTHHRGKNHTLSIPVWLNRWYPSVHYMTLAEIHDCSDWLWYTSPVCSDVISCALCAFTRKVFFQNIESPCLRYLLFDTFRKL